MMAIKQKKESPNTEAESAGGKPIAQTLIVGVCVFLMIGISYVMFQFTVDLLTQRLQERLIAIASTAASQFDSQDIIDINAITGIEAIDSDALANIIEKLNRIRDANENIQYVYVMRRTSDQSVIEFVADADSLSSPSNEDLNGDGISDNLEEIPMPGDPYEVDEYPVLKDEAFYHPAVDRELQPDKWGLMMAAYAPIQNENGETVAIIGMDVLVNDFNKKTQATLLPFLLFVLFLVVIVMLLTLMLARVWKERVEVFRELDRQKDELLSIVSHQLATPVSSMKWYLEMLLDGDIGKLTKEQEEHVKTLQLSAANLTDLVHMILDVSRIQLGRMKVDKTDLDLNEFFKEVIVVIDAKAQEKGVKFEKNMPEKLPIAWLDKRLMHMTLENLLSNAVKYTPKGGKVTLNLRVENNKLTYEVIDTGCGIPKADQEKIFGKLFRASNVQKIDGNGFGLYVAKGAVEAQGGKIEFKSSEGKGTTFTVILPLTDPAGTPKS